MELENHQRPIPGFRGDTATNVTKPATLETGAEIKVPLFINPATRSRSTPAPASIWSAARRKRPNAREQAHSEPRRRKSSCAVGARCFLRSGKQCAVAEGVRRDS